MFGHGITYLGSGAVAAQAQVLGSVRTLYLGSEERFVHLLMRMAEEILNGARSFWLEFPQAEGPAFAWLDSSNQHDLHHRNQTEISFEEILNAALQYRHVLGWTQLSPLLIHDINCGGGPERKAGAAAHLALLGAVM